MTDGVVKSCVVEVSKDGIPLALVVAEGISSLLFKTIVTVA